MIVAVAVFSSPPLQHSPIFGQRASSHTVLNFSSRRVDFNSKNLSPLGMGVLSQLGSRPAGPTMDSLEDTVSALAEQSDPPDCRMKWSSPGSLVLNSRPIEDRQEAPNFIIILFTENMAIYGVPYVTTLRHYAVNKLIRKMSTDWLIGAIDAGTTSSRMMIFDREGQVVCMSRHSVTLHCPKEGWAEHDPVEVLESIDKCMDICGSQLAQLGRLEQVKAVGLAVHRESTLAFDQESGQPLSQMILWMDTRTQDLVKPTLNYSKDIKTKSGLIPSTYFSAYKMRWILENVTSGKSRFATADTWIIRHLTGAYKTDVTNASRTMLMNLRDKAYDDYLLNLFSIKQEQLPKICDSNHYFGIIEKGPFAGVNISAVMGDQQASLLGQNCVNEGEAKCTLGTGAFILVNAGDKVLDFEGLIATTAGNGHYAIEAPIAMAASGVNWIKGICGDVPADGKSEGVLFVPALSGLLAPYWMPSMAGSFHNLTLKSTKDNMVSAVYEAIAFFGS